MVRLKTRYILFEILYPPTESCNVPNIESDYLRSVHQSSLQSINTKLLLKLIRTSIEEHFGAYGTGTTGSNLVLKYFSNQTSTGIIRCSREYYRIVCAALNLIHKIEGTNCNIKVVNISGTIKKCEIYAVKRNEILLSQVGNMKQNAMEEELINITDDDI